MYLDPWEGPPVVLACLFVSVDERWSDGLGGCSHICAFVSANDQTTISSGPSELINVFRYVSISLLPFLKCHMQQLDYKKKGVLEIFVTQAPSSLHKHPISNIIQVG